MSSFVISYASDEYRRLGCLPVLVVHNRWILQKKKLSCKLSLNFHDFNILIKRSLDYAILKEKEYQANKPKEEEEEEEEEGAEGAAESGAAAGGEEEE